MSGIALAAGRSDTLARDLVMLTKPRIISLLLVTTIVPMYVAGSPSLGLVLIVAAAGYLMAGGANAVNMYLDRDIDDRMARTRLRPIPAGRMTPRAVLAYGVALATAATAPTAKVIPNASASPGATRPAGIGRRAVRLITPSMSASTHMLSAPAAPAPTAMHSTAVNASTGCRCPGATANPTSPVNTTSVITRGFRSAIQSPTLATAVSGAAAGAVTVTGSVMPSPDQRTRGSSA